jgi:hypothetical protein
MALRGTGWLKGRLPHLRYARMSGEANHHSGARPSKCIIIMPFRPSLGERWPGIGICSGTHERDQVHSEGFRQQRRIPRVELLCRVLPVDRY